MAISLKHAKTNNIADWVQADLDAAITAGDFAPGTVLADIALPSDWNAEHTLTASTNKVLGTSGSTTVTEFDWSANGRSLIAAADYAAMKALLDLEIGTDVQAYDADLASWAGVTRASGFDTFAATPTSANLAALVTDETGTGALYFAGGNAGTPSAINLTNGTALPVSGITSSTSTALGVGSLELGHASDTTLSRVSAGVAAIEGSNIITAGNIKTSIQATINGGGSVITAGKKGQIPIPFGCTITGWTAIADASGSISVQLNKSTYSGFPTTSSIVASAPISLSSVQKNASTTLTGWTTTVVAGDILEFEVTGTPATITRLQIAIDVTRT